MHHLTDGCLDDARVTLVLHDVGLLIHSAEQAYDAILLDVDNGPEGLTRRLNDNLYSRGGLQAAKRALTRGGILAVWSANDDPTFSRRLRGEGFAVHEAPVVATAGAHETCHHIWFARND